MEIKDTKEQRQVFEAWCIQWNIAQVFPLDKDGQYKEYNIHLIYCAWLQGQAANANVVQWVSVEQELPNENSDILFYLDMDNVILDGYFSDNTFIAAYSTHLRSSVSHWMYHPEPPKAQESKQ